MLLITAPKHQLISGADESGTDSLVLVDWRRETPQRLHERRNSEEEFRGGDEAETMEEQFMEITSNLLIMGFGSSSFSSALPFNCRAITTNGCPAEITKSLEREFNFPGHKRVAQLSVVLSQSKSNFILFRSLPHTK